MAEQSLQAKPINRRNILKSTGALASLAAIGVAIPAHAEPLFDPAEWVRRFDAEGGKCVAYLMPGDIIARLRWYLDPTEAAAQMVRDLMKQPIHYVMVTEHLKSCLRTT